MKYYEVTCQRCGKKTDSASSKIEMTDTSGYRTPWISFICKECHIPFPKPQAQGEK